MVVQDEPVFETEYTVTENFYGQPNRGYWRGNIEQRFKEQLSKSLQYRGNYGLRGNPKRNLDEEEQEQNKQKETVTTTTRKKNPLDKYGRVKKCSICESIPLGQRLPGQR